MALVHITRCFLVLFVCCHWFIDSERCCMSVCVCLCWSDLDRVPDWIHSAPSFSGDPRLTEGVLILPRTWMPRSTSSWWDQDCGGVLLITHRTWSFRVTAQSVIASHLQCPQIISYKQSDKLRDTSACYSKQNVDRNKDAIVSDKEDMIVFQNAHLERVSLLAFKWRSRLI